MFESAHGLHLWTYEKAKVESAVQVVERWILMRLRHQRFHSVEEVNAAIVPMLEQLNAKPFQKLPGSRASAFERSRPAPSAATSQPLTSTQRQASDPGWRW